MFSVGNVGHRKSCHHRLSFAFRKELTQFFKRGAGQRFLRTKMTKQRVCNGVFAN
jgi:hypothetical protein